MRFSNHFPATMVVIGTMMSHSILLEQWHVYMLLHWGNLYMTMRHLLSMCPLDILYIQNCLLGNSIQLDKTHMMNRIYNILHYMPSHMRLNRRLNRYSMNLQVCSYMQCDLLSHLQNSTQPLRKRMLFPSLHRPLPNCTLHRPVLYSNLLHTMLVYKLDNNCFLCRNHHLWCCNSTMW